MDIAKILPLYIGQKVKVAPYGGQPKRFVNGVLKGVDDVLAHIDCYDIHGNRWQSRYSTAIENVTLVLRRLESMTEEEMKDVWHIVFGERLNKITAIRRFPAKGREVKRWVAMAGVDRLGFDVLGNVWADIDLSYYPVNPHVVGIYFREKGFDLFGLIDSRQAIDAATLSPVKNEDNG